MIKHLAPRSKEELDIFQNEIIILNNDLKNYLNEKDILLKKIKNPLISEIHITHFKTYRFRNENKSQIALSCEKTREQFFDYIIFEKRMHDLFKNMYINL